MDVDIEDLIDSGDLRSLDAELTRMSEPQIATALSRLAPSDAAVAFRLPPKGRAVEVFEDLEADTAVRLLNGLRAERTAEIVAELDPHDRARLLDELPAGVVTRLLSGLDHDERAKTETLLGYPPDSAGRRMTPEVAAVPAGFTVAEALARLRRLNDDVETIYMVPVLGEGRRLVGVASLRTLLRTDEDTLVGEIASAPIAVHAEDDQEDAARLIRDHGMIGLPVVDGEERLVGVITVDDAMRILHEEEDEDAARSGGTSLVGTSYLATPIHRFVRARVVWLLVLLAAATLTVNVLDYFEGTLEQVVTLALFIPLLIGTGGNVGSQAVTTVVRAIARDEVHGRNTLRVAGRELLTGLLLGVTLALIGLGPAIMLVGIDVALVVCLSLVIVCTLAATAGALIPLAAVRLGVDPAVVSAPFITTIVDASGLITYFLIAQLILGV